MTFSQRHGYKPVRQIAQIESIDSALRNGLWNQLTLHYWNHAILPTSLGFGEQLLDRNIQVLCARVWVNYFKLPIDDRGHAWANDLKHLRNNFFSCKWFEVYDFVEFVAKNYPDVTKNQAFIKDCNRLFQQEMSAYRFVDTTIARIIGNQEIEAVDKVLSSPNKPVADHIKRSLELLSDRKTPDYRNSLKESISAIESLACVVLGEKGTFPKLVRALVEKAGIHAAQAIAFEKLYGYSSDKGGVRHALADDTRSVDFADAKYMLVTCSAFINYVYEKLKVSAPST